MNQRVRLATVQDAAKVREIYAPIVETTAISFEESTPSVVEIEERITRTLQETPWLVCERGDAFQGYAYAGKFRARAAYQWTVEVTVYVSQNHRGKGVGRVLYDSLLECLRVQGFVTALAAIALPNPASVGLHEQLGFEPIGVFPNIGYKLGVWHDVGWWRLSLAESPSAPEPPVLVPSLIDTPEWNAAIAGKRS